MSDAAVEATKDDIEEKNDDKAGGEPLVERDTTQLDEELDFGNSSFLMLRRPGEQQSIRVLGKGSNTLKMASFKYQDDLSIRTITMTSWQTQKH